MISITMRETASLMLNTANVANVRTSQMQAAIMTRMQHWLLKAFVAFVAIQIPVTTTMAIGITAAAATRTKTMTIPTTTIIPTATTTTTSITLPAVSSNEAHEAIKPITIATTKRSGTTNVQQQQQQQQQLHVSSHVKRTKGNLTAGFIAIEKLQQQLRREEKLKEFIENLNSTTVATTKCNESNIINNVTDQILNNNTELIITFHEYCLANRDSFADLLTIVLYTIVCLIGLFGNTLVIYVVLRFSKMQTVTNIYILNLAIADECFLIGIPFLLYTMRICSWTFGEYICKAYMVSTSITQFTSSIFLLIMSADRFIAVCHPISSPRYRTIRIAKLVSALAWLTSVVLMLPVILFANTITQEDGVHHSCNIEWPEAYNKHTGTTFILYTFFLGFATPLCFILCFYYLVIKKLHAVGRKHKSKEKKRSHRKVTRLVLTVITVYVLCWLPQWISQVALINSSPEQNDLSRFEVLIFLLLGCLAYSNSAMNPILYAFLSDNFRKSFSKAFTCMAGHEVNAQLQLEPSVFTKHGGSHRRRGSKRLVSQTIQKTNAKAKAKTTTTNANAKTKIKATLHATMPGNNNSSTTTSSTTTQAEKHTIAVAMATGTGMGTGTAQTTITTLNTSMDNATFQLNNSRASLQQQLQQQQQQQQTAKNGLINTEDIVLVLNKEESICTTLTEHANTCTLQTDL